VHERNKIASHVQWLDVTARSFHALQLLLPYLRINRTSHSPSKPICYLICTPPRHARSPTLTHKSIGRSKSKTANGGKESAAGSRLDFGPDTGTPAPTVYDVITPTSDFSLTTRTLGVRLHMRERVRVHVPA